jgi:hypothetical protein
MAGERPTNKRPSNSELHLRRLEEDDEAVRARERGILEVFPRDEDAPLSREDEPPPDSPHDPLRDPK